MFVLFVFHPQNNGPRVFIQTSYSISTLYPHQIQSMVYSYTYMGVLCKKSVFLNCTVLIDIFCLCDFLCKYLGAIINIYNYCDHLEIFDCGLQSGAWKVELGHQGNLSHLVWLSVILLNSFSYLNYMQVCLMYHTEFSWFIIAIIKQPEDIAYQMLCPYQPLIHYKKNPHIYKRKTLFIIMHYEA